MNHHETTIEYHPQNGYSYFLATYNLKIFRTHEYEEENRTGCLICYWNGKDEFIRPVFKNGIKLSDYLLTLNNKNQVASLKKVKPFSYIQNIDVKDFIEAIVEEKKERY